MMALGKSDIIHLPLKKINKYHLYTTGSLLPVAFHYDSQQNQLTIYSYQFITIDSQLTVIDCNTYNCCSLLGFSPLTGTQSILCFVTQVKWEEFISNYSTTRLDCSGKAQQKWHALGKVFFFLTDKPKSSTTNNNNNIYFVTHLFRHSIIVRCFGDLVVFQK